MHSRAPKPLRIRPKTKSLVSTFQAIESLLNFRSRWRYFWRCASGWLATCSGPISLTHRFIHTAVTAAEECWKKNHLARNSELGVMIQNCTDSDLGRVRDRFELVERR
jgi:hypothetical protein